MEFKARFPFFTKKTIGKGKIPTENEVAISALSDALEQLKRYRDADGSKHEDLSTDISAYELIISSDNPGENYKQFLNIKHGAKDSKREFANNMEVINYMKFHGLWKS